MRGAALEGLRATVAAQVDSPSGPTCERPSNTLVPLRWRDAPVGILLGAPERRRRIRDAAGASDARLVSAFASIKRPRSSALAWHQDWWCWRHRVSFDPRPPQVALPCYLSASSAASGALRVIPGSHRAAIDLHPHLPAGHATEPAPLADDHPAMADHPSQVTLALEAGDAVLIDYRVLHGTHPNREDLRRDCVLLSLAPDRAALAADVRGHLIQHPFLPSVDETRPAGGWLARMLPAFGGPRRTLRLDRVPPVGFHLGGPAPPA